MRRARVNQGFIDPSDHGCEQIGIDGDPCMPRPNQSISAWRRTERAEAIGAMMKDAPRVRAPHNLPAQL